MCSTCAVDPEQNEARCPACRALEPTSGFPFDENATLEQLLTHALDALRRSWSTCVIAALIYVLILLGGTIVISVVGSFAMIALMRLREEIAAPLLAAGSTAVQSLALVPLQAFVSLGLSRMMLDVVVGRTPDAARFFSVTRLLPRALAIQLPLSLATVMPGIVSSALATVSSPEVSIVTTGWSCLTMPLLAFFGLSVWLFSIPELVISDCSAGEAMRRAWSLGRPWRNVRVLGYGALAGALVLAGVLACGVGVLAGLPFGTLLVLSLFLALRRSSGLPGPTAL
jgi:hypothetical protein